MKLLRKPVSILLSFIMIVSLFTIVPFTAGAATQSGTDGNITWTFDDETGTLTIGGTGDMNNYSSNRQMQKSSNSWMNITTAPWGDFYGQIQQIVVEEGVTSIGDNAFFAICRGSLPLKVQLSSTVTRIGNGAFEYCDMMYEIDLAEGLISIGDDAFYQCSGLNSVILPDSLISIGIRAFFYAGFTSVTVPESVETVGDYALFTEHLEKITFLGTPELGKGILSDNWLPQVFVFEKSMQFNYIDRDSMTQSDFPDVPLREEDIVIIPDGCTYLKNGEVIPLTAENYGDVFGYAVIPYPEAEDENITWSFDDETGVLTISGTGEMMDYHNNGVLPISDTKMAIVTSAPWGAFYDDIKSVIIEEGVTSVGNYAFYHYENEYLEEALTDVQLPSTITRIGDHAFESCGELAEINLPEGLSSLGKNAFAFCENLNRMDLPDSITAIKNCTFYYCQALAEVRLPVNLELIGEDAFYRCENLSEVHLPEKLESLEDDAFSLCSKLENVTLPPQLKTIGNSAFYRCAVKEIIIPETVERIGNGAFQRTKLEKVTILGTPSFGDNSVFYGVASDCTFRFEKAMQFRRYNFYFDSPGATVFVPYGSKYNNNPLTAENAGEVFIGATVFITPAVGGHSISLNGDIGLNFYINVPENTELHFEWYNKTYDHTVTAEDFDATSGYYKVQVNVAAAEMTYPITASCTVYDTQFDAFDVFSVRDYADVILDSESDFCKGYISSYGAKKYALLTDVIKKTLDYGAKAQTRFGVTDVELANAGVDYTMQPVTVYHIDTQKSDMTADLHKYGIDYIGTSIVFLSQTTLRHYYVISDAKLFAKVRDTANFEFVDKGQRICFELKDISAAQLDVAKAFTLGDSVYRYSVLDYCKLVIADESKPQADRELAMATYWYNDAAKAYFYSNDEYEDDMV